MQFELKRIQREVGITFVYVTHDQEEALTMSDRIAVMNAGNVEQIGTPTEIYDRPSTVFVASFIGQANLWAGTPDRPRQPRLRRGRGARHDAEGPARRHHDRARRPGHADGAAGTRAGLDGRARPATSRPCAATVTDLTFQGPVVRLSLAAPDDSTILAHIGPEQDLPTAAPRRRGPRLLGARGVAGASRRRHPDHRGSRGDARRLVSRRPSSVPSPFGNPRKAQSPCPKISTQSIPGSLARLAANRTSRRRFIGGGAAAAAALALGPSFLAACSKSDNESATGTTTRPHDGDPATGTLRISNWPLYMADGFVAEFQKATGLTVDYKEDFNDNEEWFAKVKEPLSRKQDIGADLVVPTQFMAARLNRLGWLNEISDAGVPNKKNLRPDLLERQRRPGPQVHRALHVRHGRAGLQQGRHQAGHQDHRRPVGSRRSRARSACSPTRRTGSA